MKIFLRQISFILLFVFISCASVKRYAVNRGNDLTDIVNIGVERNIYGASFSVVLFKFGLQHAANGNGFGIRHGHFGTYETGDVENLFTVSYYTEKEMKQEEYLKLGDVWLTGWVSHFHQPTGKVSERNLRKGFKAAHMIKCWNRYIIYYQGENYKCGFGIPKNYSLFLMEVSIGANLGIRAGINLGELVDFFAGIVGFDPQEDDTVILDPETIYFNLPQAPPKPNKEELK